MLRGLIRCRLNIFWQEHLSDGIGYMLPQVRGYVVLGEAHFTHSLSIISEAKLGHWNKEVTASVLHHKGALLILHFHLQGDTLALYEYSVLE